MRQHLSWPSSTCINLHFTTASTNLYQHLNRVYWLHQSGSCSHSTEHMHIKRYQLDLDAQKYHDLTAKTILDNKTSDKATLTSIDQCFIRFCTLLEESQRDHLIFSELLRRCLWNYVFPKSARLYGNNYDKYLYKSPRQLLKASCNGGKNVHRINVSQVS